MMTHHSPSTMCPKLKKMMDMKLGGDIHMVPRPSTAQRRLQSTILCKCFTSFLVIFLLFRHSERNVCSLQIGSWCHFKILVQQSQFENKNYWKSNLAPKKTPPRLSFWVNMVSLKKSGWSLEGNEGSFIPIIIIISYSHSLTPDSFTKGQKKLMPEKEKKNIYHLENRWRNPQKRWL